MVSFLLHLFNEFLTPSRKDRAAATNCQFKVTVNSIFIMVVMSVLTFKEAPSSHGTLPEFHFPAALPRSAVVRLSPPKQEALRQPLLFGAVLFFKLIIFNFLFVFSGDNRILRSPHLHNWGTEVQHLKQAVIFLMRIKHVF